MLNMHIDQPALEGRPTLANPAAGTAYALCAAVCEQIAAQPDLFDQRTLRHSVVWWMVTLHDPDHVPGPREWVMWLDRARALLGMREAGEELLDYVALLFAFNPPGTPGTFEYACGGVRRLRAFMAANEDYLRSTRLPEANRSEPAPLPM
jgi:hypothetical protein